MSSNRTHLYMPLGKDIIRGRGNSRRKATHAPMSPSAERFSESASGMINTFHDRKHSFYEVQPQSARRNEGQIYSHRCGKSPNATGMVKCHVVEQKNVVKRQGEIFKDPTKCAVLFYESPLRANPRPPSESAAAAPDEDIIVLIEFDRPYNGLPYPQTLLSIRIVSSKASLNDWKKQTDLPMPHTDRDVTGML